MGREVLKTAGLTVDDVQFIASATAGRLPGLVAGQIDGVALHPEDVFLARKQKPTLNLLTQLADLMPTTCSTPTVLRLTGSRATARCCAIRLLR